MENETPANDPSTAHGQPVELTGVPWYRPETYDVLRRMCVDHIKMHRTYSDWLVAAHRACQELKDRGTSFVCVDLDPETFAAWCARNNLQIDANARGNFAAERAADIVLSRRTGGA